MMQCRESAAGTKRPVYYQIEKATINTPTKFNQGGLHTMKKKAMSLILAAALTVSMTAGMAVSAHAEDSKSVGFVTFGLGGDFFQQLADTFVEKFEAEGWENCSRPERCSFEDGHWIGGEVRQERHGRTWNPWKAASETLCGWHRQQQDFCCVPVGRPQ